MLYWTGLCVLHWTCRQDYETLFHVVILSKHHHHHHERQNMTFLPGSPFMNDLSGAPERLFVPRFFYLSFCFFNIFIETRH
jgi:hypothetical protein